MVSRVLISYRRSDTAREAERVYDRLSSELGAELVFRDLASISPGADFVQVIDRALEDSSVVIAMIGPSWSDCIDERGQRRLDDRFDFVRREIAQALAKKLVVIPVMCAGASAVSIDELPDELKPLARRQTFTLRDDNFNEDLEVLSDVVAQHMASSDSTPAIDAASIVLGSSQFPFSPELGGSESFAHSAEALNRYIESPNGLSITEERRLNLFDDDRSVIDQVEAINNHLATNQSATDLFVFYVGHGGFLPDREYYLALHSTKARSAAVSGLRIKALAHCIDEYFADKRVYLILDCCFAGEAVAEFMSPGLASVVERETFDAFPEAGTSLLVSAAKGEPAINPADSSGTMFTSCLMEVLRSGRPGRRAKLSLEETADLVAKCIKRNYGQRSVLPEVHSPSQRSGDIAKLPVFPNPAYTPASSSELPKAIEDAIKNPLASVRKGAIFALKYYLEGEDRRLASFARQRLELLALDDISETVRRAAHELLDTGRDESSTATEDGRGPGVGTAAVHSTPTTETPDQPRSSRSDLDHLAGELAPSSPAGRLPHWWRSGAIASVVVVAVALGSYLLLWSSGPDIPEIKTTNQPHTIYYDVVDVSANDPDGLNVRAEPHFSSKDIGSLAYDARCAEFLNEYALLEGASGVRRWVHVKHGQLIGWVNSRYLRESNDCPG